MPSVWVMFTCPAFSAVKLRDGRAIPGQIADIGGRIGGSGGHLRAGRKLLLELGDLCLLSRKALAGQYEKELSIRSVGS